MTAMKLEIIFGWHLDGPSYPEETAVGKLAVGPIGLISQLALRLGLIKPFPAQAVRIAEYMSRLQAIDHANCFFSQSLKTDSWGTAKSLLHLRDELVLAGWMPDGGEPVSERLKILAAIENLRTSDLSSITDLSCRIAEKLEAGSLTGIDLLLILEEERELPPVWQRIVRALRSSGVVVRHHVPALHKSETDVARVANFLVQREQVYANGFDIRLAGDGSFVVVEADDEVQASDYISSFLKTLSANTDYRQSAERTVVIRGSSTSFLDQLLQKNHLPILGGSDNSPLRGFMLLLPLALELCWKPFDPRRIVEFLMLPHCPVPPYIASAFLRALKSEPGIGGSAWSKAWETALERRRDVELSRDGNQAPDEIERMVRDAEFRWKLWLEPPLFDPGEGIPAPTVISICDRIQLHAQALHNVIAAEKHTDVFAKTALYADTLAAAVRISQLECLPRSQLHRILASVIGDGYRADQPQASLWTPIDHPGQIFGPADTVIWWGFVNSMNSIRPNPWTIQELQYLKRQGVILEHPQTAIMREVRSWRRPLLAPAKHLLLVKPRTVAGRPVVSHPFFHELSEMIESTPHHIRTTIIRQAIEIYRQGSTEVFSKQIEREPALNLTLPAPRPVWKVQPGVIALQRESPSSLDRLLSCPLSWLLKFFAKIDAGILLTMAEGEQLAGNVAHAVFATVFSRLKTTNESDVESIAAQVFDELCPRVAAPLLLPGNSLERQRLRKAICEGAADLWALIKDAGYSTIISETGIEGSLENIEFSGRPDVYLLHPNNQDFVIDLKWTRRSVSHRRRELAEGQAIQLAMYSAMCRRQSGNPTEAGYYMISQRQLLSSAQEPFPNHSHVFGPSLSTTFGKIVLNYKTHMAHMSEGTIYATGLTDSDEPSETDGKNNLILDDDFELRPMQIPDITLALEPPCKICAFGRLCGQKGYHA